jgi:hypothetical protein
VVWVSYYQYFHTDFVEDYDEWWIYAVYNFFCRSGFYQKILNAIDPNIHDLYEQFCMAFKKKEFKTIYLAAMEDVDFSGPNMHYNDFQIRKFTE